MSKEEMVQARELIKQRRFDEARAILRATDHHQAEAWLKKLDEIDPPNIDPEATLIEKSPTYFERELPPPMATPDDRPARKNEGEIPMSLAIGSIGLVVLVGLCIIGVILLNSSLQKEVVSTPQAVLDVEPNVDPASAEGIRPISFGTTVSSSLNEDNDQEEVWSFDANAGDRVVITMRSDTIDSLLYLYTADGEYLIENDDSGQGVNNFDSQIIYSVTKSGQYLIYANLWTDYEPAGNYTLSLERN